MNIYSVIVVLCLCVFVYLMCKLLAQKNPKLRRKRIVSVSYSGNSLKTDVTFDLKLVTRIGPLSKPDGGTCLLDHSFAVYLADGACVCIKCDEGIQKITDIRSNFEKSWVDYHNA